MSVSSGQGRLGKAIKDLQSEFAELRRYWNDDVVEQFEKNHLAPLVLTGRSAVEAMGHIEHLLLKMKRDCE
ncbi:MAG: hypothetical protein H6819_04545 [Phycisphaerales bacterium]|nr:hypothetical protein [Phycisphaerales bacterium]MCB9856469.1 hypothetical protein [Phycisphaerales bacterium]MCB9863950.1 hypothetical protein [Phycisphaerales bacterium]